MSQIRVHVVDYGRTYLQLRYTDPATGLQKTKSSKTKIRREAERAAGKWERELNEGTAGPSSRVTWSEFRDRYQKEHLSGLAKSTFRKWLDAAEAVEALMAPKYLSSLTAEKISTLASKLRDGTRKETTIDSHLAHLKAAMNWAVGVQLLASSPRFPKLRRSKRGQKESPMKGRPISSEEFEAMLATVPTVLEDADPEPWRFFLRGLYLSGLRLDESLRLWWHDSDNENALVVDLSREFPLLRVPSEGEKGNKDRLLPIVPDFANFLLAVPEADRQGLVFQFPDGRSPWYVSKKVSEIGQKAGVVVSSKGKKPKYASSQDLRRSFGFTWSRKVMPPVLKELMRHENIQTTMRYYVGVNAEETARMLWEGNTSGNSRPLRKRKR